MTLDEFVDEGVAVSIRNRCTPTDFIEMRKSGVYTTVGLITKLVESSEPRSGFVRMQRLGIAQWSPEAAVLKYPALLTDKTRAYAKARLEGVLDA
jgi:hypothetical protein